MRQICAPKLKEQKAVPHFQLPSNRGKNISPWDYGQKSNLVIFFFHGSDCAECRRLLGDFAANYQWYQEAETEVLAVSLFSAADATKIALELNLPFPVLADESGSAAQQYTCLNQTARRLTPAVFVVDRYGSLYSQTISETERGLPSQDEITDSLHLIEAQCPECGVSEWTMPES